MSPDFKSSAFPMRSANSNAAPIGVSPTSCKKVCFDHKLTDEYQIAHRRCKRGLSTSTETSAHMMLSPDFKSSAFPMRSANSNAAPVVVLPTSGKKVCFAHKLTDEYQIAHRRCKRGLSTSTEQVLNQVLKLQRKIQHERDTIELQSRLEAQLVDQKAALVENHAPAMAVLQLKNLISSLELRQEELEDEIFSMRMGTLRTKGLHKQLVAEMKEQKATVDQKVSASCTPSTRFGALFGHTLWNTPAGGVQPRPIFEGSWAA